MQPFSSDFKSTPTGQAHHLTNLSSHLLSTLLSPSLGPQGTYKLLISPALQLTHAKSAVQLCGEIQFSDPITRIITQSALNHVNVHGDFGLSFTVFVCEGLCAGLNKVKQGVSVGKIRKGLRLAVVDVVKWLERVKIEIVSDNNLKDVDGKDDKKEIKNTEAKENKDNDDKSKDNVVEEKDNEEKKDENTTNIINNAKSDDKNKICNDKKTVLEKLAFSFLSTKLTAKLSTQFSKILTSAFLQLTPPYDTSLIELITIPSLTSNKSEYFHGLVLDHGNRHPKMPTQLTNCALLITNLSLEYEKPEFNSEFQYKDAFQRDEFVKSERLFIFERVKKIAEFGRVLKEKLGKNLVVISEKGIDQISLEVLADAGILGLRRAKRRNLERLTKLFGGNVVSEEADLLSCNVGFADKVWVEDFGEDKFTFVEGGTGGCVLIRGDVELNLLKNCLKVMRRAVLDNCYLNGGLKLYGDLITYLEGRLKEVDLEQVFGYKVFLKGVIGLCKALIRNKGEIVEEGLEKMRRGEVDGCVDCFGVVKDCLEGGVVLIINLVMVDGIVQAGKMLKEEKDDEKSNK